MTTATAETERPGTEIGTVRKNAGEIIRVEPTTYGGHDLLAVRVFYKASEGDYRPTRKGLTCRRETWEELLPIIEAALAGEGPSPNGANSDE
jgi:hypothetical protein